MRDPSLHCGAGGCLAQLAPWADPVPSLQPCVSVRALAVGWAWAQEPAVQPCQPLSQHLHRPRPLHQNPLPGQWVPTATQRQRSRETGSGRSFLLTKCSSSKAETPFSLSVWPGSWGALTADLISPACLCPGLWGTLHGPSPALSPAVGSQATGAGAWPMGPAPAS